MPANLDIIGTMNTADRSVEALDTALRRRFEFEEIEPKSDFIKPSEVAGVDLPQLLQTINARIERLLDRDHRIGHSYLMDLQNLEGLKKAFANKILPLLQEYFYHDPSRIGLVLGAAFVEVPGNGNGAVKFAKGPWESELEDERPLVVLKDPKTLDADAFRSVYSV